MEWVLFDLNGTLLDPRAIGAPLGVPDAEALALAALDDAIAQAMADTLTGEFREFPEYLEAGLRRRLVTSGASVDGAGDAMEIAKKMPPFDDASAALDVLGGAGLRVGVLTNSAASAAKRALDAAGLAGRLDAVLGADAVGAYKPDRRVYDYALGEIGAAPGATCLVAAHGWDVLGARRAGMRTGWVAHKEIELLQTVPEPDYRAETLEGIARAITA